MEYRILLWLARWGAQNRLTKDAEMAWHVRDGAVQHRQWEEL